MAYRYGSYGYVTPNVKIMLQKLSCNIAQIIIQNGELSLFMNKKI